MADRFAIALSWPMALVLALIGSPLFAADDAAVSTDFFESKVRPVLVEKCYSCHSAEAKAVKGGLRLDTREATLKGGDTGPAVVPGKPEESLLLEALKYEGLEMPPSGRLDGGVVADFERWIRGGAPDPRNEAAAQASTSPAIDLEAGRSHWAFQTPKTRALPDVADAGWSRRPIDRFVRAEQQKQGLSPGAEVDRRTLIRRVTFDLTGLPPTPAEVDAFIADSTPDSYERLVERLLASPRFGERWARPWLDLARFAEDQAHIVGDDKSLFYPNAWMYRDWVVGALNRDVPFDRFVRLQLAADLAEPSNEADLPALGFLGLGPKYYARKSPEVMADEWEDRVDIVGRGLLGLTIACARCHDHKYDPIPTADYYALAGVFASTEMYNRPLDPERPKGDDGQAKKPEDSLHVVRDGKSQDLNIFIRGNVGNKGAVAPRRFLSVLASETPEPLAADGTSGRRGLAEAVASPSNPLTARVFTNRVWGLIFGRPLVGTPSNFGTLGEAPSHPELLDDLAARFVASGWSTKALVRELVTSATYRQSSQADRSSIAADPENRWLARMPRRRLGVESWRDAVLSASGRLDAKQGGPSTDPADPESTRRTLYSKVSRLDLDRMLALFDFPDPNVHAERRSETTTPLQKLFVLNSPFMVRQAEAFANRLAADAADDQPARIRLAYRLLYGREPDDSELQLGLTYLGSDPQARWPGYAQALLASNEMLFVD